MDDPFKAALQATRMAVLMIDPRHDAGPVVFANEAFFRLTGYPRHEIVGRQWQLLQGPETDRDAVASVDKAICDGESIETELLSYRKDGSLFWSSLVVSPIRDPDGNLCYFLFLQSDVSEKKAAEFELTRTKRYLEEQIDRQIQELQAALDQKTALLHEVDHRVKNNLQVISSLVLLKARRLKSGESRQVLQELAERINALSTVHRLLYASGDVSRFDLATFARDIAPELMTALPAGQVELVLDVEPVSVPAAKAASYALLLNELIGNAVKHAFPDGRKGMLTVRIRSTVDGLTIAVEDDGVGLHGSPSRDGCFGKTLIELFVGQLKGRLNWIDRKPGTCAEIHVSAKETTE